MSGAGVTGPGEDVLRAVAVYTAFDEVQVLRGVDVGVRRGEVFVVMGPSGCGKTTLLRHLCGLLRPSAGTVFVEGKDLYALAPEELTRLRLRTGLSFQGGALLGSLSVLDNVALPLRENTDLPDEIVVQVARMKLDMVGLLPAADLLPASLSGGMRKRAAVARAMAMDPEILFFDEPSAGLDPITAAEVDHLILELNRVFGITTLVVTHDLESARAIADRIVVLLDGQVAARGTAEEIWSNPDPRISDFVQRRMPEGDADCLDLAAHLED